LLIDLKLFLFCVETPAPNGVSRGTSAGGHQKRSEFSCPSPFLCHGMLEKGVDIRYIKDILGHFSIKTTERYLHVRKEQLVTLPTL
jgi:hypothetical protein